MTEGNHLSEEITGRVLSTTESRLADLCFKMRNVTVSTTYIYILLNVTVSTTYIYIYC